VKRLALGVAALLVASQLLLPRLAESRLRSELAKTGSVTSVEVHAFPALKLLVKRADSVRVRMRTARIGAGDLGDRLAGTRRTHSLDARVTTASLGPLKLRDVRLEKDGDELSGSASLDDSDLQSALPVDLGLHPVSSSDGALVMEADVGPVAIRARLSASDGALLIAPDGLLGGFASVRVFDDPRVRVLSVAAEDRANGFTVVGRARLSGDG
jgi:hypothetical protein